MKKRPDLAHEALHLGCIAGLDEVGCGPWAGPLVAAAVILPEQLPPFMHQIDDSKKLTKNKREFLYQEICLAAFDFGIGIVNVDELDELKLRGALPIALAQAAANLEQKPDVLLVDGIRNPKLPYATTLIKRGDQLSLSIATASVIAKVTRDRIMEDLHNDYPMYGWQNNAGYGTLYHQIALQKHGISPYHRKSYKPIQAMM